MRRPRRPRGVPATAAAAAARRPPRSAASAQPRTCTTCRCSVSCQRLGAAAAAACAAVQRPHAHARGHSSAGSRPHVRFDRARPTCRCLLTPLSLLSLLIALRHRGAARRRHPARSQGEHAAGRSRRAAVAACGRGRAARRIPAAAAAASARFPPKQPLTARRTTPQEWVSRYREDRDAATAELLTLLVKVRLWPSSAGTIGVAMLHCNSSRPHAALRVPACVHAPMHTAPHPLPALPYPNAVDRQPG